LNTLIFLTTALVALVSVPIWIVAVEAIAAQTFRSSRTATSLPGTLPKAVLLMPAHNEEQVIARTLKSLVSGCPQNCRILCVAHNCSDKTAEIARGFGVDVLEVSDAGTGGKPDALKAGLKSLDADPPEIVVIVDADCLVTTGTVLALIAETKRLGHPVMGAYFFSPAEQGDDRSGLSSLAAMLKNFIRPLGLRQLGLPCLLNGSGSAYPFDLVRNAPHGEGAIAEDYQLTIDLLNRGCRTTFLPHARVDGLLPKQQSTALRQRRRWEHGHLFLSLNVAPGLITQGLFRLDRDRIALGLELLVPPLAFLALLWLVGLLLSLFLLPFRHPEPLLYWMVTSAAFGSAILAAWLRFAGVKQTLAALFAVPAYLFWKLPIYRDFFGRRETRWMKTSRD
jgi:cellulose synthase/poly-beta-1,6-N-acetylglucosamine synthase-like glycosyltransferase